MPDYDKISCSLIEIISELCDDDPTFKDELEHQRFCLMLERLSKTTREQLPNIINYMARLSFRCCEDCRPPCKGGCNLLYDEFVPAICSGKELVILLQYYFKRWPHYSGDIKYPIPDPHNINRPSLMYALSGCKWARNDYCNLRRKLFRFIATQLTNDLKALKDRQHD